MLFLALIRSKLNYAAPAWQPWLPATNLSCLDCLQNCSLWLITDQFVPVPLEAVRLEVKVQSYHTCTNCLIPKATEKVLGSTNDHPKRVALAADIPLRLQNCSRLRQKAKEISTPLSPKLHHRQNIISTKAAYHPSQRMNWDHCSWYH